MFGFLDLACYGSDSLPSQQLRPHALWFFSCFLQVRETLKAAILNLHGRYYGLQKQLSNVWRETDFNTYLMHANSTCEDPVKKKGQGQSCIVIIGRTWRLTPKMTKWLYQRVIRPKITHVTIAFGFKLRVSNVGSPACDNNVWVINEWVTIIFTWV